MVRRFFVTLRELFVCGGRGVGGGEGEGEGVERDIYFIILETKRKRDILHLTLFLEGQWHEISCCR
jgi:hypothetical protein